MKGITSIIHNGTCFKSRFSIIPTNGRTAWRVDFNLGLLSFESNVKGLRRLLDLALTLNLQKFIFLSTYGVFHRTLHVLRVSCLLIEIGQTRHPTLICVKPSSQPSGLLEMDMRSQNGLERAFLRGRLPSLQHSSQLSYGRANSPAGPMERGISKNGSLRWCRVPSK